METREELLKRLKMLENKEKEEMRNREYPRFKKLIGKTFRIENSYSDGPSWYVYQKIIDIQPKDLYFGGMNDKTVLSYCRTLFFEVMPKNIIHIEPKYDTYVHSLGEEIDPREFSDQYQKMIEIITNQGI